MKESLFNISELYDNNSCWVHNTLTTSVIIIDNEEYERFVKHLYDSYY